MSAVTHWLNASFGVNFSEAELQSIKDFSLMWNTFENRVCGTNYTWQTAQAALAQKAYNISDFQDILDYFKQRYMAGGVQTAHYPFLNLRPNDNEPLVQAVLTGTNNNLQDILVAITIIVFRYRSNLMHGLKDIEKINEQKDNFDVANQFLMKTLTQFV